MLATAVVSVLAGLSAVSARPGTGISLESRKHGQEAYLPHPYALPHCKPNGPPSCSLPNTTHVSNTCCYEAFGGKVLSTQFWDYYPATGGNHTWTLHGLWPDHCDGSYSAYCAPSRELSNITQILQAEGKTKLLGFMNEYWLNNNGTNEAFWEHEYNKHATCFDTFQPSCFNGTKEGHPDLIAFLEQTTFRYSTLPTYKFLAEQGIVPTTKKTYTLNEIEGALIKATGHNATVQCDKQGFFSEVWYTFVVQGSAANGHYIHTEPDGAKSSCNATGIKYVPKGTKPY